MLVESPIGAMLDHSNLTLRITFPETKSRAGFSMKFCSSQSTMLDGFGMFRGYAAMPNVSKLNWFPIIFASCFELYPLCLSLFIYVYVSYVSWFFSIAFDSGWFPIKSPRCWYVLMLPSCKSPNKKLKIICRKSSPETGYPRLSSLRSGNLGITARSLMLLYQKTMPFAPPQ